MKSPCRNLDVFDFKAEEELQFPPLSNKRVPKLIDNKGGFDTEKMSCLKGDSLFDISRDENQHIVPSELRCDNLCEQLEVRVLSTEATALMDEQLNSSFSESTRSDEADDVFADADESPSESSSTSSFIPENNVPLEGHESSPDGCFGIVQKLGDRNMALICPDYIIYQGRYSTESVLIFSKKSIKLKDSTTHGNQGLSRFEWKIEDIVDIQSQWSTRLEIAMVKLRMLPKDETDSLVEDLQFAVADMNWPEKQKNIMSLNVRYKAKWNVVVDTETEKDEHVSPGTNGESIWRKSYFPNFVEFFDEVVYPKGDPDAVSISKRDVDLLQPDIFVNDTIIDFYIKYLKNQLPVEKRIKFHFFNSFFFRKLIDLDKDPISSFEGKTAFQRVRKWTRKVNIFEKDYVFIPVNYSYHWSLIVICHPGEVTKFQATDEDVKKSYKEPCILHMDSMKGSHNVLKTVVQSYLWEEWKERNKDTSDDISPYFFNLRFVSLELPQQPNAYDCGLFLLHYVERFLEEAHTNFSPSKITQYSNFLNLDWFRPEEPCLKRAQIQRLICKILEGENSPAACSGKPWDLDYPSNNNALESKLECISKKSSLSKNAHGNLSGSQSSEGIEITLLQTSSSQYGGDSSLVLREFLEVEATAGPFLDGQYQTFDQTAAFGTMEQTQNDVEACGQFVYASSNINHESFFYSSNELRAKSLRAEHNEYEEYPETSIGGSGYSSEVEIQENNSVEKTDIIEEKIDEPRSSSAENLISAPSQMLDVAEFESCDRTSNSHCIADNDLNSLKVLELTSQQGCNAEENGDVFTANIDVVHETLASEIDEKQDSETISEILIPETSGMLYLETVDKDLIGDDLVLESDGHLAAKRTVLSPESDEQQPAKRLCLDSTPNGEKGFLIEDP